MATQTDHSDSRTTAEGKKAMTATKLLGLGAFLLTVFVLVPVMISATGRWDFYYRAPL